MREWQQWISNICIVIETQEKVSSHGCLKRKPSWHIDTCHLIEIHLINSELRKSMKNLSENINEIKSINENSHSQGQHTLYCIDRNWILLGDGWLHSDSSFRSILNIAQQTLFNRTPANRQMGRHTFPVKNQIVNICGPCVFYLLSFALRQQL